MMRKNVLLPLAFCFLSLHMFAATAVETHGFLKVQGTQIVDASGNPVQLKGMSFFWSQWMGKYWNADCVKWLQEDWKCSVVRASMGIESGGYLTDPNGQKALVKKVVDAAIARGIYVIIDWHDHNAPDHLAQSKAFFTEMAQTYGKYPNVLYEIYNEPDNESWATVKNYATQVITEIRKYDSKNLIIVGTPTWSQDVDIAASSPISGTNIAYTLHFYAATHKASLRNKATTAMSRGIALFVTECGTSEASGSGAFDAAESTTWFNFLDQNKISWCNWSVADKQETSAALTPGASSTGGWPTSNLTASGNYIRNKLRSYNSPYTGPGTTTNQAPNVSLTSPVSGSSFVAPASISIAASASDADGTISKVEFYNGTTLLNSDATAPYAYTWSGVAAGSYSITARAYDNAGATKTSSAASVSVTNPSTNQAPNVSLTAPVSGSSFIAPASISIAASASDADGTISKVEFYNGTTLLNSDATAPYAYSWSGVAAGSYNITARAYDNAGATKTSTAVSVSVTNPTTNQAPNVSLTSPATGSSFVAPASISIAASASDADGTISKVEFYNGTTLLNSDATAPYAYTWSGVAAGSYSITARAYDNAGATKTSSAASVSVTNPSTGTIGINGVSCVTPGVVYSMTLNPEAGATSAGWWANSDVTVTVDPADFKKATIKVNSATGSFLLSSGVNFSGSPYYKEYTKTITIGGCAARQLEASISPYPATSESVVKTEDGSAILELRILNTNGQILFAQQYAGESEVLFRPDVASGVYVLQIITPEGILNRSYLKVE